MSRIIRVVTLALLCALAGSSQTPPPTSQAAWFMQTIPTVTLTGRVTKLVETDGKWGSRAIIFSLRGTDTPTRILVAPSNYAKKIGLSLYEDALVTIVGVPMPQPERVLVTVSLTLDGRFYSLRDPFGRPRWGDTAVLPQVIVTGTVSDILPLPHVIGNNSATGSTGKNILLTTFILNSPNNGPALITIGPQAFLKSIGLTLSEGAIVTVTGWQRKAPSATTNSINYSAEDSLIVAHTLIIDKHAFILRNASGRPGWIIKPAPNASRNAHGESSAGGRR